jgi:methionyl-tRNA synthetase
MSSTEKLFYITTPIYYVNDIPHIGHAYTTIAADVSTRFKKLEGYKTFFLTGTDEHGQKVQQAAEKNGVSPKKHVDSLHKRFKDLWVRLDICNNDFIRTTEERHTSIVKDILSKLYEKGEIYKDTYEGWYCMPCERFWTEKDVSEKVCPECKRPIQNIKESNYFFKMGDYQEWLTDYIQSNEDFIKPVSRKNEVLGFLKKPLENLCISRPKERLPWGIPLPFDQDYVTYVWFDALINYISIHGSVEQTQKSSFWPASHHLVGKDILTTHAVYWSTMLKAMGLELPKNIFAHGWWTVNGQKMSKSLQNVVDPNLLIDQFGSDVIRYFLMREVPFGQDGDFSHKALIGRVNSDLANNLGNLLNRSLNMIKKYCDGKIPHPDSRDSSDEKLISKAKEVVPESLSHINMLAYNKALTKVWELLDAANLYINDSAPWNLAKSEETKGRLNTVLYNSAESIRIAAILLYPFMPQSSENMLRQIGIETPILDLGTKSIQNWGGLEPGIQINPGPQLFPRIDDKQAEKILEEVESPGKEPEKKPIEKMESEQVSIEDVFKIDLRTGKILEAEKVKKSKKLVKLKVDIGCETRQVVAGIAASYEPDQLIGRTIILVANLKPAKLMGIESQGMVLAGSNDDKIVLAGFDQQLDSGIRVK